jgi:hypothetical protein
MFFIGEFAIRGRQNLYQEIPGPEIPNRAFSGLLMASLGFAFAVVHFLLAHKLHSASNTSKADERVFRALHLSKLWQELRCSCFQLGSMSLQVSLHAA